MKKTLGFALIAILTLTMSMSVFAAGSSSATAVTELSSTNNADGTITKVVESVTGTQVAVTAPVAATMSQGVVTSASIATGNNAVLAFTDTLGKKIDSVAISIKSAPEAVISNVLSGAVTGTTVKASDVVAAVEISVAGFNGGTASIPLAVSGVVKGESVYGIHIKADGTTEYIPAIASDNGVVNIVTTSFSPIIIVKGQMPAKAPVATTTTATDTTTSPKTGEVIPYAMILAFACLAGAAVCTKKLSYNK